jgi:hypothetical protein
MKNLILFAVVLIVTAAGCAASDANLKELQKVRAGALDVVLLSARDSLKKGSDSFVVEFHSASGGNLVDVGNVQGSANMPMAGMPMMGSVDVQRTSVPGRYAATAEFSMAGTWRLKLDWDGADGSGSVTFPGAVQ